NELRIECDEIIRRREAERLAEERREAAEAAERKRQETARKLADASARLDAKDVDRALAIVAQVLNDQPDLPDPRALDGGIGQAIGLGGGVDDGVGRAPGTIGAGRFDEARRAIADVEKLAGASAEIASARTALATAEEKLRLEREGAEKKRLAELEAKRQA